jgi:hypothetical protein
MQQQVVDCFALPVGTERNAPLGEVATASLDLDARPI